MRLTLQLEGLMRLQRALASARGSIEVETMLKNWGMRYMAEQQEAFAENSRGGGAWPNLAPATIAAKKKKGSRTPSTILRDRSILFHALDPLYQNGPGQYREIGDFSIEIGVVGPGTYASGESIGRVAAMHHMGEGRLPERKILGVVSAEVQAGMVKDAEAAISKINNG